MIKKGLVLEGGGMRGVFTTGVLDFFIEKGIGFDNCIAVSAGSCHACSYLAGQKGRAYNVSVNFLNDKRYCSLYSLITTGDLFGAKMCYEIIPRKVPVDNQAFKSGKTAFQAVVTNCLTGQAEYPQIKDLYDDIAYIRASSSLPMVSRMVMINGIPYLDGGIADSIPLMQSISQGNEKNVVIMTQCKGYQKKPNSTLPLLKIKYKRFPALLAQMKSRHESYNNSLKLIYQKEQEGSVFLIQPKEPIGIKRIEKNPEKLRAAYNMGYEQAKINYEKLLIFLSE